MQRSGVDVAVRRRRWRGPRGPGVGEGPPGFWIPRFEAWRCCGSISGVREAGASTATQNRTGQRVLPAERRRGTAGMSGAASLVLSSGMGGAGGVWDANKRPRGSWGGVPGGDAAVIAAGRCSAGIRLGVKFLEGPRRLASGPRPQGWSTCRGRVSGAERREQRCRRGSREEEEGR